VPERQFEEPGEWRLDTFLVEPGALNGAAVTLGGSEGHHAVDVVRVRPGDLVRLIDGAGAEAVARVERTGRSEATLALVDRREHERSAGVELTVAQAILKGRSFDEVVRRCSEVGVAAIVPTVTERAVGRLSTRSEAAKRARWESVALSAVKQSRGVFVPRIGGVARIGDVCALVREHDRALVAWEEETAVGLAEALGTPPPRRVLLVVGPEGGLAAGEVSRLAEAGAVSVTVGRRVLRADWAAAAISALISYECGGLLP